MNEMTDEIKMFHFVVTEDGECGAWEPLNPQPSCENCKHNTDENDYGNLILCDTLVIGGLWMKKEFYCSYWKAKEVKKHKQLPEYSYGDYIGQEGH